MNKNEKIIDLDNNNYSMLELRNNIYVTGLFKILQTQKITEEFAVNYILNKKFQLTEEEEKITINYVLKMQPHLDFNKLLSLYVLGPTDFDFPNFERYAETGMY